MGGGGSTGVGWGGGGGLRLSSLGGRGGGTINNLGVWGWGVGVVRGGGGDFTTKQPWGSGWRYY